jgi:hypothetical protein
MFINKRIQTNINKIKSVNKGSFFLLTLISQQFGLVPHVFCPVHVDNAVDKELSS